MPHVSRGPSRTDMPLRLGPSYTRPPRPARGVRCVVLSLSCGARLRPGVSAALLHIADACCAAGVAIPPVMPAGTWVLLTEAPEGRWGPGGHADTNAELVSAARAQIAELSKNSPGRSPSSRRRAQREAIVREGVVGKTRFLCCSGSDSELR
jgi:hypothetical protein